MISHTKFGPDRFCRFDVYWIQTNKQTDKQAKFILTYMINKSIDFCVHEREQTFRTSERYLVS